MNRKWFFISGKQFKFAYENDRQRVYVGFHADEELVVHQEYEACLQVTSPEFLSDRQFFSAFKILELTPEGQQVERKDLVEKEWEKQETKRKNDEKRRRIRL